MLIGAHVSVSGGLPKAVERGVETGSTAIQIFNQSPRMWKPTAYSEDDFAAFREAMAASSVDAVVIHAVYLINCATDDPELAEKSVKSLTQALQVGDGIGATGVVLHPGAPKDQPLDQAIKNVARAVERAFAESDSCKLLFENAAGNKVIGQQFEHLGSLIEELNGHERAGACLDSCHMFAGGYDVRTQDGLTEALDEFDKQVGIDRLGCVHLNDSKGAFDSGIDRHQNLGDGEIGRAGCAAFLSEPRFEELPLLLEVPGLNKDGPGTADVALARELREEGLKARG